MHPRGNDSRIFDAPNVMEGCSVKDTTVINSIQIFNCIFTVPTSFTATLANFLVLISIWRTPSLHLPSNILLAGLAVSDFGVGLVVQPTFFAYNFAKLNNIRRLFCVSANAHGVSAYCLCGVSLLTLTAIALDRYIAIRFHLRYQEMVTVKRASALLIIIWLGCVLMSMLFLWSPLLLNYCAIVSAFVSFVMTTSAYCKIYLVTRRHQVQIQTHLQAMQAAQRRDDSVKLVQHKRSALSTLLIYCVFLSSYLPYTTVVAVMEVSSHSAHKQAALEVTTLLVHINSTLSPFLYCWRFRQIRTAVVETVQHYFAKVRQVI